jgi:ATP-dependent DNA helicase RecQ
MEITTVHEQATSLLRKLTGNAEAEFRDGQLAAIEHLVVDRRRVLCVQRTGWGKSAVYFIATQLLREAGRGPTVIVSPLLALMRNQIAAARALGLRAETVNSANREDWDSIFARLAAGGTDLLLISPERLNNPAFRAEVLPELLRAIGLLVVDEAHCISDWGHDFRPDYRRIATIVEQLPSGTPVLCTTATANDRVVEDVESQLRSGDHELLTLRGSLDRASLRLEVVDLPSSADRLAWLATHLPELPGSGIVYCLTVRDAALVAGWLRSRGLTVDAYSGETEADTRPEIEDRLLRNEVKAVVATSALGMGYDKPDLGFVVHYQSPGSPIAYYQQVGRAGRGVPEAHAVLLRGREDRDIQDYFIDVAFPPREQVERVLEVLSASGSAVGLASLERVVNLRRGRLEAMLKVLEVEGAVTRSGGRWAATGRPWAYDEARIERVTAARRAEQQAMEAYAAGDACLLQFLRGALDDPDAEPCGRCAVCTAPRFDGSPARELVAAAVEFIRRQPLVIESRRRWMGPRSGAVPAARRAEPGRALSRSGDAGWGRQVEGARREGRPIDDELVAACVKLVGEWGPEPGPQWVTAVPSRGRPDAVRDFAERLAAALGLPFAASLERVREGAPQAEMENSAQQAGNVIGAFAADPAAVRGAPVLLVDDRVDSRWTLTVAADALRAAGSGPVHPLALAMASG